MQRLHTTSKNINNPAQRIIPPPVPLSHVYGVSVNFGGAYSSLLAGVFSGTPSALATAAARATVSVDSTTASSILALYFHLLLLPNALWLLRSPRAAIAVCPSGLPNVKERPIAPLPPPLVVTNPSTREQLGREIMDAAAKGRSCRGLGRIPESVL